MNGCSQPAFRDLSAAPIGIFDSGVGGLTVLRELDRQLPQESILYFGDTARLPYGNRSAEEILHFVRDIMDWMVEQGVKMVMMACNTSSALVLEQVQQEYDLPILGLIWPGARAAAQAGRRIGVIATPATVASNAYRRAILEVEPSAQIWQVGCPEFVPLIEQGQLQHPRTRAVAATYLQPLVAAQIDALVYGCTHYPHLEPVLGQILPSAVQRVDPAVHLVATAARELTLLNLRHRGSAQKTRFYVSGEPEGFANLSVRWLGYRPRVEQVIFAPIRELRVNSVPSGQVSTSLNLQ
ncbi:glutamate racemase [Leptolyngbya sp. PCC 6406]|uniref:glutamate racemase n=1 Tax=Leptolyngbya sp. PCC 6406 TaxID=1173264 RepID=UPI0002AC255D|nr:glutamate racemase [Leptolyngbya sp. PCC 6406]